ncbi:MAG: GNAT family N-acetyltransferase [Chloroflexi bacterium]|nr:GNAT family N-acetyltransferase [Chloroflexota bacterium]
MSKIVLVEANGQDAETIVRVLHAAFAEYRGVLNPPSGAHNESVASVRARMQTARWVLAETAVERRTVGCVLYEPHTEFMYLGRLAVLPEFRGRGIGNALIEYVEKKARQAGYTRVRLGVRVVLDAMRAAYERRGYRFVEAHAHEGFETPTYVMLEKEL